MSACPGIPEPGTNLGPCLKPCRHRDCAQSRADSEKICRYCEKPIGYETRYYADGPEGKPFSALAHALCVWKHHEAKAVKP